MRNTPKEWTLIDKIRHRVQRPNEHTVVPLGDDAFVFKNFPGYSVICQDMMVENVHFRLDYCSAEDLGYKALAVNLSDVSAMGARPHFVQVSLALPKKLTESWLDDFYKSMAQLADNTQCEIVGGDLTFSEDKLIIDVSVHGSCEKPLTRKGACVGDLLLSSGPLGLSYIGLLALQKNQPGFLAAKMKHRRPTPRLDLVPDLLERRFEVHAMMDCSDGLINDGLRMLPADAGLVLFKENLPLHADTLEWARLHHQDATDFVLWGGEDYELLIAISPDLYGHFSKWHLVGQFTEEKGVFLSDKHSKKEISEFKGWKHF
ncbi:MAG: thiamine-monophosphate kinase [Bdellovibrio sp. ArHS]|uniref:thiamine-phosphate kinase n=1 Tax=Bdellovibrio sp. ArHS TaxID=1569284 RepID=UPI000583CAEC|nr:thiamine-phosphate kinase [Bdellovibrio sp. ArHS]KHD87470.1 MAG: thiamine-monophosphate kinase [Bdellovibrio sp. ArHS]